MRKSIPYSWRKEIKENENKWIKKSKEGDLYSINGKVLNISTTKSKEIHEILTEQKWEIPICVKNRKVYLKNLKM